MSDEPRGIDIYCEVCGAKPGVMCSPKGQHLQRNHPPAPDPDFDALWKRVRKVEEENANLRLVMSALIDAWDECTTQGCRGCSVCEPAEMALYDAWQGLNR